MPALPTEYAARKALPVFTFLTKYFPDAFLEVVRVAVDGDKQHGNEGKEIHWAREKSTDQLNTALRHMIDYGTGTKIDTDGRAHLAKAIWRLSAQLQLDLEAETEPTVVPFPNNKELGTPPDPESAIGRALQMRVGCKVAYAPIIDAPRRNMSMIRQVVQRGPGDFCVWNKHNNNTGSKFASLEELACSYAPVADHYQLTA